jgi:hypothetical protein
VRHSARERVQALLGHGAREGERRWALEGIVHCENGRRRESVPAVAREGGMRGLNTHAPGRSLAYGVLDAR